MRDPFLDHTQLRKFDRLRPGVHTPVTDSNCGLDRDRMRLLRLPRKRCGAPVAKAYALRDTGPAAGPPGNGNPDNLLSRQHLHLAAMCESPCLSAPARPGSRPARPEVLAPLQWRERTTAATGGPALRTTRLRRLRPAATLTGQHCEAESDGILQRRGQQGPAHRGSFKASSKCGIKFLDITHPSGRPQSRLSHAGAVGTSVQREADHAPIVVANSAAVHRRGGTSDTERTRTGGRRQFGVV
jgi:hypothetical protein